MQAHGDGQTGFETLDSFCRYVAQGTALDFDKGDVKVMQKLVDARLDRSDLSPNSNKIFLEFTDIVLEFTDRKAGFHGVYKHQEKDLYTVFVISLCSCSFASDRSSLR